MKKLARLITIIIFLGGIVFLIFRERIIGSWQIYQLSTHLTEAMARGGGDQYSFQIAAGIKGKSKKDTVNAYVSYKHESGFQANIQYDGNRYIISGNADSTRVYVSDPQLLISGKGMKENSHFDVIRLLGEILENHPQTSFIPGLSWSKRAGAALWALVKCKFDRISSDHQSLSVITFPEELFKQKLQLKIGENRKYVELNSAGGETKITITFRAHPEHDGLQSTEHYKKVIHVGGEELNTAIYRGALRAGGILLENKMPPKPDGVERRWGRGVLTYVNDNRVFVAKGTHRQIGEAHGALLKNEIRKMVDATLYTICWVYTLEQGSWFIDDLRTAYKHESPFIPAKYQREMEGMAESSGISLEEIHLTNVFPALFHCSGFALFNAATVDGVLYHGRVLDYITELGLQYYPLVQVLHPQGGNAFANIGYAGFIGSVSGMNDQQLAFGEMGGGVVGDWDGMPMAFLMREGMERAKNLDEALSIFRDTPRTCEYYYVISDGKIPDARGLATTPEKFEVVKPGAFNKFLNEPVKDALLMSAGSRYKKLVERVKADYGKIDREKAIHLMDRPVAMKSNLHDVLFVPQKLEFWVANAGSGTPACNEPYTHYSMKDLLKLVQ